MGMDIHYPTKWQRQQKYFAKFPQILIGFLIFPFYFETFIVMDQVGMEVIMCFY